MKKTAISNHFFPYRNALVRIDNKLIAHNVCYEFFVTDVTSAIEILQLSNVLITESFSKAEAWTIKLFFIGSMPSVLKALLHTNVLNDITVSPCSVSFLELAAEKKSPKKAQL